MPVNKMTDNEKLMYSIMGAIAKGNVPVVYRGAMITKLILQENHFQGFVRATLDIDASWAGATPPAMGQMTSMLNTALMSLGLTAIPKREYGEKVSAGFKIVDAGGDIKLSIDIDMRTVTYRRSYHFGNITFEGVAPNNVISDKISVVSSDKVFRRIKDLLDLYALAHCVKVKTADIYGIWDEEKRSIGSFDAFINRQKDLNHSYEKLRRVNPKPEFTAVYTYLKRFLTPFSEVKNLSLVWDNFEGGWEREKRELDRQCTDASVPPKGPMQPSRKHELGR
jgi:hypothetical protein